MTAPGLSCPHCHGPIRDLNASAEVGGVRMHVACLRAVKPAPVLGCLTFVALLIFAALVLGATVGLFVRALKVGMGS